MIPDAIGNMFFTIIHGLVSALPDIPDNISPGNVNVESFLGSVNFWLPVYELFLFGERVLIPGFLLVTVLKVIRILPS